MQVKRSSALPRRKRRKQSRAQDPRHANLVKLVRELLTAAKTLRDERGKFPFATGERGSTKVGEVYAIFSVGFEGELATWSAGSERKNDPALPRRVTDRLLSIFSNTAVEDGLTVAGYEHLYELVHVHWRTSYPTQLKKVVDALRARSNELRLRELELEAARASQRVAAAGAALDTDHLVAGSTRSEGHAGHHDQPEVKKAEIRVYQSDPPVGRDSDRDLAIADLTTHRGLVLFGAPGQGKTALARYIALATARDYATGIYEVDLESERQIENLPRLIASSLGYPDAPSSYDILQKTSSLVILDGLDRILNAAEPAKLRTSLRLLTDALRQNSRVIITCQKRFEKEGLATREVKPLARDHAVALFHRFSEDFYRAESGEKVSDFVTGDLSAHPLSIKIVGPYGSDLKLPFVELKRLWKEKWLTIAKESTTSVDDRGLLTAFELTYESLSPTERLIFLTLSLLPDGIAPDIITATWPQQEVGIYNEALRKLRHRSLLEDKLVAPSFSGRLRGPLFQFALAKKQFLDKDRHNGIAKDVEASAAAIDRYFDSYVAAHAPQYTDVDPRQKNELIRAHFHNIHASLDRRLEPSTRPETVAAAHSVLALYWAYHNNLSGANNPISSTEDATTYLSKAANIFLANGKSGEATKCRYYIGNILWLRGDISGARVYLKQIEEDHETDEKLRCDTQRAFAHMEYKEGDINRAVEWYHSVTKMAAKIQYELCVLKCHVGLLDAYRKLGELDVGIQTFESIRPRINKHGGDLRGNALRGFAYLLAEKADMSRAKTEYENALRDFEGVSQFGQAHCQRGLGDVYVKMGKLADADAAFDTSMRLYDHAQKNPSLGVGLVYLGRGRLSLAREEHESAARWCRQAAELFDPQHQNEPYELAVAHELLADIHLAVNQTEGARASYEIARAYFGRAGARKIASRLTDKLSGLSRD
jgi:tetratricopeptide (TPR) repeat protein